MTIFETPEPVWDKKPSKPKDPDYIIELMQLNEKLQEERKHHGKLERVLARYIQQNYFPEGD